MPRRPATLAECALAAWPPRLRALSFDTVLVPLPPDVVAWLVDDLGVWLPDDSAALPTRAARDAGASPSPSPSPPSSDAPEAPPPPPGLADVSTAINEAIAKLGGEVLPKLDWSAPVDAAWLRPGGRAACAHADEVMLLLKASDRVASDVDELARLGVEGAGDDATPPPRTPTLALRRWHTLRPDAEFRLAVKDGVLTAACQRDVTQHFASLSDGRARRELTQKLTRFVAADLDAALPHLTRYVADVYVHTSGKVRLVDVAPAGGTTHPLLLGGWDEAFRGGGGCHSTNEEGASSSSPSSSGSDGDAASVDGDPPSHVRLRVVPPGGALAPGARALYGAPHDMVDGELLDGLVDRLRVAREAEGEE